MAISQGTRLWISILLIAAQPLCVLADEKNIRPALDELASQYDHCVARIKQRDAEIRDLKQQIENYRISGKINRQLIEDCEQLSATTASLIDKQQGMLDQSHQIEKQFRASMALCQMSVNDLKSTLVELNQNYNAAVNVCLKPWYARWEFWLGGLIGLAFGIPL